MVLGAESRTIIRPCFNVEKLCCGVGDCQQNANKTISVGMGEWFDSKFLWKSNTSISFTPIVGSRGPH